MECKPEEDSDSEHCKESIHTLLNLGSCGLTLLGSVVNRYRLSLLRRCWEALACSDEDRKRDKHSGYRCDKRVVDTLVEHLEVAAAECSDVAALGYEARL